MSEVNKRRADDLDEKEFVLAVAQLAWEHGLAANSIVSKLKLDPSSKNIMRVKRALDKARARGILKVVPSRVNELQDYLSEHFSASRRRLSFTVVNDSYLDAVDAEPVCTVAAQKFSQLVAVMLRENKEGQPLVVCNTGGRTLATVVRHLPGVFDRQTRSQDIVSIAHNRAGRCQEFDRSSSFLAVRLADICGGRHFAVSGHMNDEEKTGYEKLTGQTQLILASAGSTDGLYAQHMLEEGLKLPADFIGDFAFVPLDKNGKAQRMAEPYARMTKSLDVAIGPENVERFTSSARGGRILCVLDDPKRPNKKCDIAIATLHSGLATDYVLGSRLAQLIVDRLS